MDSVQKLKDGMEQRRQALLKELEAVHSAIKEFESKPALDKGLENWLKKLEDWHEQLHAQIEKFPTE